jgi:hypothetical protein
VTAYDFPTAKLADDAGFGMGRKRLGTIPANRIKDLMFEIGFSEVVAEIRRTHCKPY